MGQVSSPLNLLYKHFILKENEFCRNKESPKYKEGEFMLFVSTAVYLCEKRGWAIVIPFAQYSETETLVSSQ